MVTPQSQNVPDDADQFGANGSCSARGLDWETGRRMYDAFSVKGNKLEPESACTLLCTLVVKGPSILLRTWTLRPDIAVEPVHHQNRTKRGSRANCQCQRWEHLPALITFKFSAKITHTTGIPTPCDFHRDRSGGHVVPKWKSPDAMVRVSFLFPCRCLDIVKICKTALHSMFSCFNLGGLGSLFRGTQATKSLLWRWD